MLGTTFGGNHLGCAAALAVLKIIREEKLIENALHTGAYLMQRLQELDSPLIKEIRGRGLMVGVELTVPVKGVREPLLFEERIFTGYSGLYTLRILPPLVLSKKEVDIFVGSLKKVLDGYYEIADKLYKVFVVAGSEPLGTAGIQADMKAIVACGGYAAGAVTCIVDEDTTHVKGVHLIPANMIAGQIRSFLGDVGADCIKTGMLYSKNIIRLVASILDEYSSIPVVVDPVMVTSSGDKLLEEDAVQAYKDYLFPRASILTPNKKEAEWLCGKELNEGNIEECLKDLSRWGNSVVIKSVENRDFFIDYYYNPVEKVMKVYKKEGIRTRNVNGTGDSFASAIATFLSKGYGIEFAVAEAERFIQQSIELGARFKFGRGFGPVYPYYEVQE